ncbi:hypothetical protein C8R46DRAFT_1123988 [Mycena filopes]|nr:hypothetical protein C8R46DRAFT_1123988 [Mycena filopes]
MADSCSLMDLPTELLVEIVSHYSNHFTFLSPFVRHEYTAQRQDRQQALRSLSQSCSRIRHVILPILWEEFDASKPNFQAIYTQSEFAKSVAPYIKSVHVSMKLWSPAEMEDIFLFLEFLRTLPNLTGLQIQRVPWSIVPILTYAFNGVRFPTVTALSVPNSLDVIFPSFPNVAQLASPELSAGNRLIPAAAESLPKLEGIAGLRLAKMLAPQSGNFVKALSAAFPHLRVLSVATSFPAESVEPVEPFFEYLRVFTNLSSLAVVFDFNKDTLPLEALIEGAKAVLRASRSREVKLLWVWADEKGIGPRVIRVERC